MLDTDRNQALDKPQNTTFCFQCLKTELVEYIPFKRDLVRLMKMLTVYGQCFLIVESF